MAKLYKAINWKVPMDDLLSHYSRDFIVNRNRQLTADDERLAVQESGISKQEYVVMKERATIDNRETGDRGVVLDYDVRQRPQPQAWQPQAGWSAREPLTVIAVTDEKTLEQVTRAAIVALAEAHARTVCRAVMSTNSDEQSGQEFVDVSHAVNVHAKVAGIEAKKVQWRQARDAHYDNLVSRVFDVSFASFVKDFSTLIPRPQPIQSQQLQPMLATIRR